MWKKTSPVIPIADSNNPILFRHFEFIFKSMVVLMKIFTGVDLLKPNNTSVNWINLTFLFFIGVALLVCHALNLQDIFRQININMLDGNKSQGIGKGIDYLSEGVYYFVIPFYFLFVSCTHPWKRLWEHAKSIPKQINLDLEFHSECKFSIFFFFTVLILVSILNIKFYDLNKT